MRKHYYFFTLLLLAFASGVQAADIYVNDDGGSCLGQPADNTTISDAIAYASPADNVFVCNGTYPEDIDVYKELNIIGESRSAVILVGTGTTSALNITADKVNVTNLTITKGTIGILVAANNTKVEQTTIRDQSNVTIMSGIYLQKASNGYFETEIDNISAWGNNSYGIYTDNDSHNNFFTKTNITNIREYSGSDDAFGIFDSGNNNTYVSTTIQNVSSQFGDAYGVYSDGTGTGFLTGRDLNFTDLSIKDVQSVNDYAYGIDVFGYNKTFKDVSIEKISAPDFVKGIRLWASNIDVINATIKQITSSTSGADGIYIMGPAGPGIGENNNIQAKIKNVGSNSAIQKAYGFRSVGGNDNTLNLTINNVTSPGGAHGVSIPTLDTSYIFTQLSVSNISGANDHIYGLFIESQNNQFSKTTISDINCQGTNTAYGVYTNKQQNDFSEFLKIKNIKGNGAFGLALYSGSGYADYNNTVIDNVTALTSDVYPLWADSSSTNNEFNNLTITNIQADDNVYGIQLDSAYNEFANVIIENATSDTGAAYGFALIYGTPRQNTINGLSIKNIQAPAGPAAAIYFGDVDAEDNTFENVLLKKINASADAYGIRTTTNIGNNYLTNTTIKDVYSLTNTVLGVQSSSSSPLYMNTLTITNLQAQAASMPAMGIWAQGMGANYTNTNIQKLSSPGDAYAIYVLSPQMRLENILINDIDSNSSTAAGIRLNTNLNTVKNANISNITAASTIYSFHVSSTDNNVTNLEIKDIQGDSTTYGLYVISGNNNITGLTIENITSPANTYPLYLSGAADNNKIVSTNAANMSGNRLFGIMLLGNQNQITDAYFTNLYANNDVTGINPVVGTENTLTNITLNNLNADNSYARGLYSVATNNNYTNINLQNIQSGTSSDDAYGYYINGQNNRLTNSTLNKINSSGITFGLIVEGNSSQSMFQNINLNNIKANSNAEAIHLSSTVNGVNISATIENVSSASMSAYGLFSGGAQNNIFNLTMRNISSSNQQAMGANLASGSHNNTFTKLHVDTVYSVSSAQGLNYLGNNNSFTDVVIKNIGSGTDLVAGIYAQSQTNNTVFTNATIQNLQSGTSTDNAYGVYLWGNYTAFTNLLIENLNSSYQTYAILPAVNTKNNTFDNVTIKNISANEGNAYGVYLQTPNYVFTKLLIDGVYSLQQDARALSLESAADDTKFFSTVSISNVWAYYDAYGIRNQGSNNNFTNNVSIYNVYSEETTATGFRISGQNVTFSGIVNVSKVRADGGAEDAYGIEIVSTNLSLGEVYVSDVSGNGEGRAIDIDSSSNLLSFGNVRIDNISTEYAAHGIYISYLNLSTLGNLTITNMFSNSSNAYGVYGPALTWYDSELGDITIENITSNESNDAYGLYVGNIYNITFGKITISNIDAGSNAYGLYALVWDDVTTGNISITNIDSNLSYAYGLYADGIDNGMFGNISLANIKSTNSGLRGVYLDEIDIVAFEDITITNLVSNDNAIGLYAEDIYNITFAQITINNVTSASGSVYGIFGAAPSWYDTSFEDITITNMVSNDQAYGVYAGDLYNITLANITIINATGNLNTKGIYADYWNNVTTDDIVVQNINSGSTAYGVDIDTAEDILFGEVTINNVNGSNNSYGIRADANNMTLLQTIVTDVISTNTSMGINLYHSTNIFFNGPLSITNVDADQDQARGLYVEDGYGHNSAFGNVEIQNVRSGNDFVTALRWAGANTSFGNVTINNVSGTSLTQGFQIRSSATNSTVGHISVSNVYNSTSSASYAVNLGGERSTIASVVVENVTSSSSSNAYGIYMQGANFTIGPVNITQVYGGSWAFGVYVTSDKDDNGFGNIIIRNIESMTYPAMGLDVRGSRTSFADVTVDNVTGYTRQASGVNVTKQDASFQRLMISNVSTNSDDAYGLVLENAPNFAYSELQIRSIFSITERGIGIQLEQQANQAFDKIIIDDTYLSFSQYGGTNTTITNSEFTNDLNSIRLRDSGYATLINTSFDDMTAQIEDGNISVYYYLQVQTLDLFGDPMPGVNVSINDTNGFLRATELTGPNGLTSNYLLHSYDRNNTTWTNDTPFNVSTRLAGYYNDSEVSNLLDSTILSFKLAELGTLFVNDDGNDTGCLGYDYQNITAGVENAQPGDTVLVCEGTYNESVLVNKTVELVGSGRVVVLGNSPVLTIEADQVNASGMILAKGSVGLNISGDGCRIRNISVENISSNSSAAYGLYLSEADRNEFTNVSVLNVSSNYSNVDGVYMFLSGNNTFTGLSVEKVWSLDETQAGIYVDASDDNNFSQTTIRNITTSTGSSTGITNLYAYGNRFTDTLIQGLNGSVGEGVFLTQQSVFENLVIRDFNTTLFSRGIEVYSGDSGNVLRNVLITNLSSQSWDVYGLELGGANTYQNVSISNLYSASSSGEVYGIYLDGENSSFENISIKDVASVYDSYGVFVEGSNNSFENLLGIQNVSAGSTAKGAVFTAPNNVENIMVQQVYAQTVAGVEVGENASNSSFKGIYVYDVESPGGTTQGYGVLVEARNTTVLDIVVENLSAIEPYGLRVSSSNNTFGNILVRNISAVSSAYGVYFQPLVVVGPVVSSNASQNNTVSSLSAENLAGTTGSVYAAYLGNGANSTTIFGLSVDDLSPGSGESYSLYAENASMVSLLDSELRSNYTGSDWAIYMNGTGTLSAINVTYDEDELFFDPTGAYLLARGWWLTVYTSPADGVNVEVKNSTGALLSSCTTVSGVCRTGLARTMQNATPLSPNSTVWSYNGTYDVYGSKSGYDTASKTGIGLESNNNTSLSLSPSDGGGGGGGGGGGSSLSEETVVSRIEDAEETYEEVFGSIVDTIEDELDEDLVCVILGEELCELMENVSQMLEDARGNVSDTEGVIDSSVVKELLGDANANALTAIVEMTMASGGVPNVTVSSTSPPVEESYDASDVDRDTLEDVLEELSPESLDEVEEVINASGAVNITVTEEYRTYVVEYPNGTNKTFTVVLKTITAGEDLVNVVFVEEIDKDVSLSASELFFREDDALTIIRDDPVAAWSFETFTAGAEVKLGYVVEGEVTDTGKSNTYVVALGGELECPSGYHVEDSKCVADLECPEGQHEEAGACVVDTQVLECGEGQELIEGQCVAIEQAQEAELEAAELFDTNMILAALAGILGLGIVVLLVMFFKKGF